MSHIKYGNLVLLDEALCHYKNQLDLFVNDEKIRKKYFNGALMDIGEELELIDEIRNVFKHSIEKTGDFNYTKPFREIFPSDSIEIMKYALKRYKEDLSELMNEFNSKFSKSPEKFENINEKIKKIEQILGVPIFQ